MTIARIIAVAVATMFFAGLSLVLITLDQPAVISVHFVMPPPPMPQEEPTISVSGCQITFNPSTNTIFFDPRKRRQ